MEAPLLVPPPTPLPRSPGRLSRDAFSAIFSLTILQPWLKEAQEPLFDLIDECSDDGQQELVCNLLRRFLFLEHKDFENAARAIARYIEDDLGLNHADTIICALDDTKFSDSSQVMTYMLKCVRWKGGKWPMINYVKSRSAALEIVKSRSIDHIVLVDEFVGTGETATKSIKKFRQSLAAEDYFPKVFFAAVVGMENTMAAVANEVNDLMYVHSLRRGISDSLPPSDRAKALEAMAQLESNLAALGSRGALKKHHLGYKQTEALYSRAGGNTPNNVFPIFWWDQNTEGAVRNTLLQCS